MNVIKLAGKSIIGKKVQSIMTFIIVLFLFLAEITGLLLESAVAASREDTLRQLGVSIAISPKKTQKELPYQQVIDSQMIKSLMTKEHITGVYSINSCICNPLNFSNVKEFTGVNPATQNENADSPIWGTIEEAREYIWLVGDIDMRSNENFYKKHNWLLEGRFPDEQNQGAVISEQLAEKNNLKIGDVISVQGISYDGPIEKADLEIIGIYQTKLGFEIMEGNYMGEAAFAYNPCNAIYTDRKTVTALNSVGLSTLSIWVDSPMNLENVIEQIEDDKIWEDFYVTDTTSYRYDEYAWQLETTNKTAKNISQLTLVFGNLILFILLTFWGNSYFYDVALYVLLGYRKGKIFIIQLTQAIFITLTAAIVALVLSIGVSNVLNNVIKIDFVSIYSNNMVMSFATGANDIVQNFQVSLRPDVIYGLLLTLIVISITATLLPLMVTVRIKPCDIVAANKRG